VKVPNGLLVELPPTGAEPPSVAPPPPLAPPLPPVALLPAADGVLVSLSFDEHARDPASRKPAMSLVVSWPRRDREGWRGQGGEGSRGATKYIPELLGPVPGRCDQRSVTKSLRAGLVSSQILGMALCTDLCSGCLSHVSDVAA